MFASASARDVSRHHSLGKVETMKLVSLVLLSACLHASCSAPAAVASHGGAARAEAEFERGYPSPRETIEFAAQDVSLEELVTQLTAKGGANFVIDGRTKERLAAERLTLTQPLVLAPAEACAWIESQLASSGFVLAFDSNVTPATMRVSRRGDPNVTAVPLDLADLELARRHPALLVQFTITLPHTDVRTLQSTLRPLMGAEVGALLPVGNTQTVVVQGSGQRVAHIVDLLREADEQARVATGGQDPRRPAAPRQASSH